MNGVEYVGGIENPLAIIIRQNAKSDSIDFITEQESNFQIGIMRRPNGYKIPSHFHNPVKREITGTQEVLFIRSGLCAIRITDGSNLSFESELKSGDVIFLAQGTHSIEMLEECEILEVKQGPYAGVNDKTIIEMP